MNNRRWRAIFNYLQNKILRVKRYWCWKYKFVIPEYMCDMLVCRYYLLNGGHCVPKDLNR
ncbi:hypothetical protein GAH_01869 [Geoglobus ahangari]|uniref:Uncharacterized protein n=1 Tax=Geoglobus ahangari TaxID=113653 RepID=A0A0F7IDX5_9EURY|nr:hypothetical protein GAH_01869 [Geoglobus ahangari]